MYDRRSDALAYLTKFILAQTSWLKNWAGPAQALLRPWEAFGLLGSHGRPYLEIESSQPYIATLTLDTLLLKARKASDVCNGTSTQVATPSSLSTRGLVSGCLGFGLRVLGLGGKIH